MWWPSQMLPWMHLWMPAQKRMSGSQSCPGRGSSTSAGGWWLWARISETRHGRAVTEGATSWAAGWAWDSWDTVAAGSPWGIGQRVHSCSQPAWMRRNCLLCLIWVYVGQKGGRSNGSDPSYSQGSSLDPLDGQWLFSEEKRGRWCWEQHIYFGALHLPVSLCASWPGLWT